MTSHQRSALALASLCVAVLVAPSASAADRAAGKEKAGVCATCHGLDGIAKAPDAPNLAGTNAYYLAEQLKAYRSGARGHPQMAVIAKELSDADIADLAAWYSAIKVEATMPE